MAEKIKYFGNKIGGARKDIMRSGGLKLEDIADWTDAEKRLYVNKECIWPFKSKVLCSEGTDRKIVYWQRKMRTLAYKEPHLDRKDFTEGINNYLSNMIIYKDMVMAVKTEEDRCKFYEEINELYKTGAYKPGWSNIVYFFDVYRSRYKVYGWDQDCNCSNFPETNKREGQKKRKGKFIPPQLEKIEREGIDYREGLDITPEFWQETFNFYGCEFGNWTNQNDRQCSLNYAYDALRDLADVLGIDTKSIAYNGKLSLAFGSRGVANSSSHYEPARAVINLTKFNGAGTVAHEWFHSLDHEIALSCGVTDEDFASKSKQKEKLPTSFIKLCRAIKKDENGNKTDFLIGSEQFDLCYSKTDHGYWSSETEMLARAFACYVKDMYGKKSDYLIAHADTYVFTYDNESKCAHPQGEERDYYDELFDDLFIELKKMGILSKKSLEKVPDIAKLKEFNEKIDYSASLTDNANQLKFFA